MNESALPELPGGWVWTKLGDICSNVKNKSVEGSALYLEIGNIDIQTKKYLLGEKPTVKGALLSKKDDILISRVRPTRGAITITQQKEINVSSAITVLRTCQEISPFYLHYFLAWNKSFLNYLGENSTGTMYPTVKEDFILTYDVPLAPLPEQRRIVAKLEELFTKLDAGVSALKKTQAQLKRYRQSGLKAACEGKLVPTEAELAKAEGRAYEPADVLLVRILKERREKSKGAKYKEPTAPDTSGLPALPEGWGWATIDQVSQYIVDCLHSTPKFMPEGKYCIDTNCIEQGKILFEKARFVSEETYNERVSRLVPQANDILFAREGTIGTAVIVPPNTELCLGQRMMMFRAASGVIPSYFMWALQSKVFENQWKAKISGSTVPHVNIGDIKVMAILLPPTLEQRRIVAEVERRLSVVDEVARTVEHSFAQAQRLAPEHIEKGV